jgi:integrase
MSKQKDKYINKITTGIPGLNGLLNNSFDETVVAIYVAVRISLLSPARGQKIVSAFEKDVQKSGLDVPKGTGFYSLRRTAATIAARSGDLFAVQRLLGHADLQMATRYVQDVSKQTDRVIQNSRMYVCQINR